MFIPLVNSFVVDGALSSEVARHHKGAAPLLATVINANCSWFCIVL